MRAFLEKIERDYLDDFVYMSKTHLINMGIEIIDFDGTNLASVQKYSPNIKNDIMIGSVEACSAFFKACGIEIPTYLGYPKELTHYLGRNITEVKVKDLQKYNFPYFIKPAIGVKLFTGTLVENDSEFSTFKKFYPIDDETDILLSEPINFTSEYRCFVHKGILKGIKHYTGDFTIFPDVEVIKSMIVDYKTSNVSYTLDVGITDGGKTLLIEVNDFWAIGSYGLDGKIYSRMTIDRFQEIYKNSI